MEGPSIVIATEELRPFLKKKVVKVSGTQKSTFRSLKGQSFLRARSWGKHLLLSFKGMNLRVHFLMFGSYRIDNPRENRVPKLELKIGSSKIYFYSCAIKILDANDERAYDWSTDLMSKKWDPTAALAKLRAKPKAQVADVLMDQNIFSGLGNIMKNEILFRMLLHPETKVGELSSSRLRRLVKEAHDYAWLFYAWKKANVLKRNWLIMRKRKCPKCGGRVTKKPTGVLKRIGHFCRRCQNKR